MSSFIIKGMRTFLLLALVVMLQFSSGNLVPQTIQTSSVGAAELGYLHHDPISIMENQDFLSQGWPGNGTIDEPYLLENLEMDCDDETGIFVANTTVFFEISSCRFTATDGGQGLWLINVTNGEVMNCISERCHWDVWNSSQCRIESTDASNHADLTLWGCTNCSAVGNSYTGGGLIYDTCTDCKFIGNTVIGSGAEGIYLIRAANCSVIENEFAENDVGIGLLGSNGTLISHNNIHDNVHYGVELYSCGSTRLIENSFKNDGVVLHYWGWGWDGHAISGQDFVNVNHVFQDNVVNGKPLGFFKNVCGDAIDGSPYGQVILVNCSSLTIDHGVIANTSIGVQILFSDNCTVTHMTMANCSVSGVVVEESNYTSVLDCIVSNNVDDGIMFERSFDALIANCSVSGNRAGLRLLFSGRSTTLNNTLTLNTWGAEFYSTSDSMFVNNTVLYNKGGVHLADDCDNNVIYGNSIGWNEWCNAQSDNYDNQWDDGISRGNRWSDYDGSGVYEINHIEVDRFPELLGERFPSIDLGLISIGVFAGVIIVAAIVHVGRSRRISHEV